VPIPTRRLVARATLLLSLLSACRPPAPPPDPPIEWRQETGYRWRDLPAPPPAPPGFTQLDGAATGITFRNFLSDTAALRNQVLAQGGGVALADIDGDGRTDIFLAKTEGKSALYRNLGGWRFEEIAEAAGVAFGDRAVTGVVFADIDGDGDQDLLVNALGGPNGLFLNDGRGRFTEDLGYPGRASRAGTTTSTLADIDGDGDLDLYVANDKAYNAIDRYSPQERAFDQVVRRTGPRAFEVVERMRKEYRIEHRDDIQGVVLLQRAEPDTLYLNDGGRFTAVAIANSPRFLDQAGRQLAESPDNFTLAARFYDLDSDGDPDLYVANDFEDPDQFWLNDGRGYFRLAPLLALRTTSNAAMAIDMGDVNRDGRVDFFSVDMLSKDTRTLKTQIPTHTTLPKRPGVIDDRPQLQRNTLFLNRGDTSFAQIAELAGVEASGWSWSTMFLDVDLDGYEDLLVGTGNYWDFMDADTQEKLRNRLSDLDWRQQRMSYPRLAVPNYAYRNRGDLTFEDVSDRWRFSAGPDVSHGMASGDLDQDGDVDVVVNRLDAPALVLRNDATASRLTVSLRGRAPNTAGIGAKIRVLGGPVALQERELTAGGLYLSHAEPIVAFAAGSADSLRIEVTWRDGTRSVIPDARPNRHYQIDQVGGLPAAPTMGMAGGGKPEPAFFSDETSLLGHIHVDSSYDDAARQFLIPHSFAQLGPGTGWIDFDGDGDDDLIVTSGKPGTTAGFRNERGRFSRVSFDLPPAADDQTMVVAVPDERGGTRLLIAQANYQADSLEQGLRRPAVIGVPLDNRGHRSGPIEALVPGDTASAGPMALADYDGDGDLDLFLGGRVIPGAYPLSPSSRFFRNDGTGRFELDVANSALVRNVGMVSAAVMTDIDQDGDPDLVFTVDWGPVKVLLNDHGTFTVGPESLGLSSRFGRWWGLSTGDFDGDGRPDLVVTGWGWNTLPRADATTPLHLYLGNFDADGSLDMTLAQVDPRLQRIAPLTSFARLSRAVPSFAERVRTFGAYADLTIDGLLGPAAATAIRLSVNTTEHLVWLNRGDHFDPRPLALEAQLSPAFAPVVADFDGDGREDLALSQNFFATELSSPRYDAGRGLLLLGDGKGGFQPVSGQRSGLVVWGDQRGAATADYDGDGRSDLVISQNANATRLFRNRGGRPGLRVRLQGPPTNPAAIGASVRLRVGDWLGPLREIQAGSGYWSGSSPIVVLGRPQAGGGVLEIRWPDGRQTSVPVAATAREVRARQR